MNERNFVCSMVRFAYANNAITQDENRESYLTMLMK